MVPNASSPAAARARPVGHLLQNPGQLGAGEVGVQYQTGAALEQLAVAGCVQLRHHPAGAAVPATRWRGGSACRCRRSHTTVVSRWLAIPTAATSAAVAAGGEPPPRAPRRSDWRGSRRDHAPPNLRAWNSAGETPAAPRTRDGPRGVEQQRPRTGGTLVEGQDEPAHGQRQAKRPCAASGKPACRRLPRRDGAELTAEQCG